MEEAPTQTLGQPLSWQSLGRHNHSNTALSMLSQQRIVGIIVCETAFSRAP
jgi:hypothetical protein